MPGYSIRLPGTPVPPPAPPFVPVPRDLQHYQPPPAISVFSVEPPADLMKPPRPGYAEIVVGGEAGLRLAFTLPEGGGVAVPIPDGWPDRAFWADTIGAAILAAWPANLPGRPAAAPAPAAPDAPRAPSLLERIDGVPGHDGNASWSGIELQLDRERRRLMAIDAQRLGDDGLAEGAATARELAAALGRRADRLAATRSGTLAARGVAAAQAGDAEAAAVSLWCELFAGLAEALASHATAAEQAAAATVADLREQLAGVPAILDACARTILDPNVRLVDFVAAVKAEAAARAVIDAAARKAAAAGVQDRFDLAAIGAPRYRTSPGFGGFDGGLIGALCVPGVAPPDAAAAPAFLYRSAGL